jgi:small-conductance mechanosensitive channel
MPRRLPPLLNLLLLAGLGLITSFGCAAQEVSTRAVEAEDARIKTALASRLARIETLREIEIEVTSGVVRLQGEVAVEGQRETATVIAENVAGVLEVNNAIEVSRALDQRLQPALDAGIAKLRALVSSLPLLGVALAIVLLFWGLSRLLSKLSLLNRLTPRNPFLSDLVRQALRAALMLVGVLIALDLLGATALLGTLLGTAGLVGLAVGFAFKDLVENYIASILLSLRQPFAPNDHIVVDGHEGLVVSMNSRATLLMTPDGNHLRIPNATVFKSVMLNYTRNPQRRFSFIVGLGVDEDLARVQKLGVEVLRRMHGVLADPEPQVLVNALADSSVSVEFLGWVDQRTASFVKVTSEAIRLMKFALDEAGIEMPEPTYRMLQLPPATPKPASVPASGSAPTSTPARARDRSGAEPAPVVQADVSLDRDVTEKIEAERASAGSDNLLHADAPKE